MTIQEIGNHALCEMIARILEDQKVSGCITCAQDRSLARLTDELARRVCGCTLPDPRGKSRR